MLIPGVRGSKNHIRNYLLLGLAGILLVLLVPAIGATPAPAIRSEFGGATIDISASSAWSMGPGDCMTIRWDVEGIRSIYIDGQGKIGWGDMEYCPSFRQSSPRFEITAKDGTLQRFSLDIHYLPNQVIACLLLVSIASLFLLACYYLVTLKLDEPPPLKLYMLLVLAIAVLGCLLGVASGVISIPQMLTTVGGVFANPAWQYFGLALAGIVFIPLLLDSIRQGLKYRRTQEFVAIAGFFVFLLLLYLPFGFDSVGQAEEWIFQAYLEGRPSAVSGELVSRFWLLVPHALANVIGVEMFTAYHIVNFLMFWGKSVLFYGILRQLKVLPFLAFLCTMLFMVYPITEGLMSLRFFLMHCRILSMMVAMYLALLSRENPNRLRIAGICLAIVFNVGSYESAYAIIGIAPIFWWRCSKLSRNRKTSMTLLWYLFPASKAAYLLLLSTADRSFYGGYMLKPTFQSPESFIGTVSHYLGIIGNVYRNTFVHGWYEAVNLLHQSSWLAVSAVAVAFIGIISAYMAYGTSETMFPSRRKIGVSMLSGFLFILPSVGILMWFEKFNNDLRRLYVYVPIGSAIATFSVVLFLSMYIENIRVRKITIVSLCLFLLFPGALRLFEEHGHFVNTANIKGRVLLQVVEQVPAIDSDALLILLTDMGLRELGDNYLYPFRRGPFDSASSPCCTRIAVLDWQSFAGMAANAILTTMNWRTTILATLSPMSASWSFSVSTKT